MAGFDFTTPNNEGAINYQGENGGSFVRPPPSQISSRASSVTFVGGTPNSSYLAESPGSIEYWTPSRQHAASAVLQTPPANFEPNLYVQSPPHYGHTGYNTAAYPDHSSQNSPPPTLSTHTSFSNTEDYQIQNPNPASAQAFLEELFPEPDSEPIPDNVQDQVDPNLNFSWSPEEVIQFWADAGFPDGPPPQEIMDQFWADNGFADDPPSFSADPVNPPMNGYQADATPAPAIVSQSTDSALHPTVPTPQLLPPARLGTSSTTAVLGQSSAQIPQRPSNAYVVADQIAPSNAEPVVPASRIAGLTSNVHSFDHVGGAKAWFYSMRRETRASSIGIDHFRENEALYINILKAAIVTSPSSTENASAVQTCNEGMTVAFTKFINKKCGLKDDGVTMEKEGKPATTNLSDVDEAFSALASMVFHAFLEYYTNGGDRYLVDPRASTCDPLDQEWTPKQRMALLVQGMSQAKNLCMGLWTGWDAVLELVSTPASSLDSIYTAKISNEGRGKKTEMKMTAAEQLLQKAIQESNKMKAGALIEANKGSSGSGDVEADNESLQNAQRKKYGPRKLNPKQSVQILTALGLYDVGGTGESAVRQIKGKVSQKRSLKSTLPSRPTSRGNGPDQAISTAHNSIVAVPDGNDGPEGRRKKRLAPVQLEEEQSGEGASERVASKRPRR